MTVEDERLLGPLAQLPQEMNALSSSDCLGCTDQDVVWGLSYFYCLEQGLLQNDITVASCSFLLLKVLGGDLY